jgi:hypothetical protein
MGDYDASYTDTLLLAGCSSYHRSPDPGMLVILGGRGTKNEARCSPARCSLPAPPPGRGSPLLVACARLLLVVLGGAPTATLPRSALAVVHNAKGMDLCFGRFRAPARKTAEVHCSNLGFFLAMCIATCVPPLFLIISQIFIVLHMNLKNGYH